VLKTNAFCVVARPLSLITAQKLGVIPNAANASIHGEVILAEAEKFDQKAVKKGSSTHKIQNYVLHNNCYCVVNRSLAGLHLEASTV